MPEVGSFRVAVLDTRTGIPFSEYKLQVSEGDSKAECYIQSEPGSRFKLVFGFKSHSEQVRKTFTARFCIDGNEIQHGELLGNVNDGFVFEGRKEGMLINESQILPFVFGNTLFTGEDCP